MNRRERRAARARGNDVWVGRPRAKALCRDDGRPYAVMRPAKPKLAMQMARAAMDVQKPELFFDGLPEAPGPYTFVGWLAVGNDGAVLDDDNKVIGKCEPGDSFVTIDEKKLAAMNTPRAEA